MAQIPGDYGTQAGSISTPTSAATTVGTGMVPGTSTGWHTVVLWFLGAMALVALAGPAPNIATMIMVLLIVGILLKNWTIYAGYLGIAAQNTGSGLGK